MPARIFHPRHGIIVRACASDLTWFSPPVRPLGRVSSTASSKAGRCCIAWPLPGATTRRSPTIWRRKRCCARSSREHQLRDPDRLKSWLCAILANCLKDHHRRRREHLRTSTRWRERGGRGRDAGGIGRDHRAGAARARRGGPAAARPAPGADARRSRGIFLRRGRRHSRGADRYRDEPAVPRTAGVARTIDGLRRPRHRRHESGA